jgi:cell division protease FtsH
MSDEDDEIPDDNDLLADVGQTGVDAEEGLKTQHRPNAARCIVSAALEPHMPGDLLAKLQNPQALAVVIRVPSAAWVSPVADAVERYATGCRIIARDGSQRTVHKADVGNDQVADKLASGRAVVGIAHSLTILPRALTAAADIIVEIRINGEIVARAIQDFVGTKCAVEDVGPIGVLDFHDIVSAFRAGSNAEAIAERLRRTAGRLFSPREDRLPRLIDTLEYGGARDWGLALGRDLEDYRAGRIPWSAVSANALFAGPPGLGKTFFARILSQHLGIPLIATSISDLFANSAGYLDSVTAT